MSYDILSSKNTQLLGNLNLRGVPSLTSGNLLVQYEMSMQVFPTAPSPTTTHLIVLGANSLASIF